MTAIEHDDWGWTYSSTPIFAYFAAPRMPACKHWQIDSTENTNMKYSARVFHTTTTEEQMTFLLNLTSEGSSAACWLDDDLIPSWDRGETGALTLPNYPQDADRPDGLSYKKCLPYYPGVLQVYKAGSDVDTTVVYGFELQARHDDTSYDGEDMELFNYSGTTFCAQDCPASSFILTRMVAEAMNAITFNAGFKICIAMRGGR